jgi:hypothetical protein
MRTFENALFTPAEAAVLTRMTLKAVNNSIDKKIVPAVAGQRAGQGTRLLNLHALMALALERRLSNRFVPELRREVFDALAGAPRDAVTLDGGGLKIDLAEPRRELAKSLRDIRLAPIYANAYPLQGRPRAQPWYNKPPTYTERRKLVPLETS